MLRWYGEQATTHVKGGGFKRLCRAGRILRDYLREKVSVPNVQIRTTMKKRRSIVRGSRGAFPSAPGEYPRKVSGHLRRNIQMEGDEEVGEVRVGTNVPYGKWLEIGTQKMARRPWLSRGLVEAWNTMVSAIKG